MNNVLNHIKQSLENNKNLVDILIKSFTIVDICATLCIGMFSLLAPNLHIAVLKKEPSIIILVVIILLMILISFRPLARNLTFNILRFFIGGIITLFILYSLSTFILWYFHNIEGTFSFRFLSFTKKASLQDKLDFYNIVITQMIDIVKSKDSALGIYLEKTPSVVNPSVFKIIHTSYDAIPDLAKEALSNERNAYMKFMQNVKDSTGQSNKYFYLKIAVITIGVVALGYIIYNYGNFDMLKEATKQTASNLAKTQQELENIIEEGTKISLQGAMLAENNNVVITAVSKLNLKVTTLIEQITTLQHTQERIIHVINKIIRVSMQSFFAGIKELDKDVANQIKTSLTSEQQDFITATSKIVFDVFDK